MIYSAIAIVIVLPVGWFALLSALAKRPGNLGVENGRLADCPKSPNCVCTQCTDDVHGIDPIRFEGSSAEALARIKKAIAAMPRTKIITETENYLHAEATSLIFRFVDDVEFLIDKDNKIIHFRSASRSGYSDLGVNRSRMEQIRAAYQAGR
jgi:uncharacterized protein (DUF1499 family)